MHLEPVEAEDDTLTVAVEGEDDTILNLIKEELLADDNVTAATYTRGHPDLDPPNLTVTVASGDPADALADAVKGVRKRFDEFETEFLDQTK